MWKDIPGWEEYYEVSDSGLVRNKRTKRLIVGDYNNYGYSRVQLYANNIRQRFFRHRLVASLFIPNPNNYPEVNHINENKSDNRVENLEWVTRTMNERANHRSNGKPYKPFIVCFTDGIIGIYEFEIDLAEEIGVSESLVNHWLTNRIKTYTNYGISHIGYDLKA